MRFVLPVNRRKFAPDNAITNELRRITADCEASRCLMATPRRAAVALPPSSPRSSTRSTTQKPAIQNSSVTWLLVTHENSYRTTILGLGSNINVTPCIVARKSTRTLTIQKFYLFMLCVLHEKHFVIISSEL